MFLKIIKPGLDGFTMIESPRMTVADTVYTREELIAIFNKTVEIPQNIQLEVDAEFIKTISEGNENEYEVRTISYSMYSQAEKEYVDYMCMFSTNITCYFLDEKGNTIDTRKPKRRA